MYEKDENIGKNTGMKNNAVTQNFLKLLTLINNIKITNNYNNQLY